MMVSNSVDTQSSSANENLHCQWCSYSAYFQQPIEHIQPWKNGEISWVKINKITHHASWWVCWWVENVTFPFPFLSNNAIINPSVSFFAAARPTQIFSISFALLVLSTISSPQQIFACFWWTLHLSYQDIVRQSKVWYPYPCNEVLNIWIHGSGNHQWLQ